MVLHSAGGAPASVLNIYGQSTLAGTGDVRLNDAANAQVSGDPLIHNAGHGRGDRHRVIQRMNFHSDHGRQ